MKKLLPFVLIVFTAVAVQADWKTWLHGTPPAPTPGPPDAKAASVSFAPEVSPDKQILDFMLAFAEAARVHDGSALKPRLSEKYVIEDLPSDQEAKNFFMQAMVKLKSPDEMVVTSIQAQDNVRTVKVEFRVTNRPPKTRTFRFDSEGKLLSADFFSLQRHGFF